MSKSNKQSKKGFLAFQEEVNKIIRNMFLGLTKAQRKVDDSKYREMLKKITV